MENKTYIGGILSAVKSLTTGLKTSIKIFFEKDETEQYPENRKTLTFSDRNRFCLEMPHNEKNEHKCVACGLCQMACPNGSITVTSEMVTTDDGKKKRRLVRYEYNLGSCMFCNLCVRACPHDAIRFNQEFETAVFDKSKLILKLNHEGSKCEEKPVVARPAAARPAAAKPAANPVAPAAKPAATPAAAKPAATAAGEKPAAPAAAKPAATPAAKPEAQKNVEPSAPAAPAANEAKKEE